jgi:hypothetical protein
MQNMRYLSHEELNRVRYAVQTGEPLEQVVWQISETRSHLFERIGYDPAIVRALIEAHATYATALHTMCNTIDWNAVATAVANEEHTKHLTEDQIDIIQIRLAKRVRKCVKRMIDKAARDLRRQ